MGLTRTPTMIKWIKLLSIVVLLTGPALTDARSSEQQKMVEAIERRVSNAQFTGAVLVSRGPTVLLNEGYGSANREWQTPNSTDTRFRIASLTKQFTAAGILLLEEQGKLRVEDPIRRYMPDAPAAWSSITIFHLLTHTSGIPDLTTFPDFGDMVIRPTTPEKLVTSFRNKPLDFAPGTDFKYTNSGYILLGYILERASARSYADFMKENIFIPLGMKSSGYDSNIEVVARRAQGYVQRASGVAIADYLDMTIPFSAGGLYSTAEDLLRWEQGLFGGQLLSASSLARMTKPFKKNYAFGVAADTDTSGNKIVWHGGAIDGFSVFLAYVPAERFTVIVLANIEGAPAKAIAADILAIANHSVPAISGNEPALVP
jgi:CubicO group peptidase (beta-lactamase class C family)